MTLYETTLMPASAGRLPVRLQQKAKAPVAPLTASPLPGPHSPTPASLLPNVAGGRQRRRFAAPVIGSTTLGLVPIVELRAQRVACKVARKRYFAHVRLSNQRLQHRPNVVMHQSRQESVPNVVGLCLVFGAGRTIAAHGTHVAEVSLGPC